MDWLGLIFAVLHAVSIGIILLVLWRLYYYIKRYRFDESKYTLLFGFVHLHWIAIAYVAFAISWVVVSYSLLFIRL